MRRVAADQVDVVLDPLEDGALVVEAGIGGSLFFHCCAGEEAVGAELAIRLAYPNKVRLEMSYSVVAGNEDVITAVSQQGEVGDVILCSCWQ